MKKWNKPEINELSIAETAHNWTGIYRDGGYVGDGIISGHLQWTKPEDKPNTDNGNNNGGETPGGSTDLLS